MLDKKPSKDRQVTEEDEGEESTIDGKVGVSQVSPDPTVLLWWQRTFLSEGFDCGDRYGTIG
jgi:hypothetical protein